MKEILKDWVRKAEGDFNTASREIKVTERENYDSYPLKSHDSKAKKGSGTKIREIELPRKRILFIKTLQKPCS
jgi:hypothetical protein